MNTRRDGFAWTPYLIALALLGIVAFLVLMPTATEQVPDETTTTATGTEKVTAEKNAYRLSAEPPAVIVWPLVEPLVVWSDFTSEYATILVTADGKCVDTGSKVLPGTLLIGNGCDRIVVEHMRESSWYIQCFEKEKLRIEFTAEQYRSDTGPMVRFRCP